MTPCGVGRNLETIEEDCFVGEEGVVGKEVAVGMVATHSCLTLNTKS